MTITLTGTRGGEPVRLVWDAGTVSGDRDAVDAFWDLAAVYRGKELLALPAWAIDADPATAWGFVALARGVFDREPDVEGDLPDPPPVPPGAVS